MPPALGIHSGHHPDEGLVATARAEEKAHITGSPVGGEREGIGEGRGKRSGRGDGGEREGEWEGRGRGEGRGEGGEREC